MSSSRLLWLVFTLLLSGCATLGGDGQYNDAVWRGQREALEQLDHWRLSGKLAILAPGQKGSARLNWQQRGEDYDLILTTLIGTTLLELHQRNGQIEIVDNDGVRHSDTDSEALVYRLTGWHIPVAQLPTWIKGLPGQAEFTLGADGRINQLHNQQWQLSYQGYARNRLWLLPTGMTLQGPDTQIKLIIHEWQIEQ
jgi:outer membrane lipoprotein LolB